MPTKRPTPAQIERMYDEGENRVTQERNDFLLRKSVILSSRKNG